MMCSTLLFSLLLLLSSLFLPTSSTSKCHKDDQTTLLSIKSSLGNPYGIIEWGHYSSNCCDGNWVGIECNSLGRVTSLDISSDNVSGPIPPQVGDLPYLTSLTFHKNTNLTGPIPYAISKLKKLTFLRLDWNSLSGPVPAFLSQLTKLDYLNLAFNQFAGSIPPNLGKLPLTYIGLDRNKLSGPIPDWIGSSSVQYLHLSHNSLSGPIPKSFSSTHCIIMELNRNQLTGDASVLFHESSPIWRLDLSRNMFEFDLTDVKLPKDIVALDLNHNKVYGGMPSVFSKREWQSLNVSYNRLCGPIPSGGNMGRFDEYAFLHNKCLCGTPLLPCK